jgi:hypothetical protein
MHLTKEQVIDYVFGDEIPDARVHLASCAECRAEEASFRRVLLAVDNLPGPPEGYADRMLEKVRPQLTPRQRARRFPPMLAVAAAIAVACLAAFLGWRMFETRPRAPIAPLTASVSPPRPLAVTPPPATVAPKPRTPKHAKRRTGSQPVPPEQPKPDPLESRLEEIRTLATSPGPSATADLLTIYRQQQEPEIRQAVIAALYAKKDAHALETLARTETDPALRTELQTKAAQIPKPEPEYLPARDDPNRPNP